MGKTLPRRMKQQLTTLNTAVVMYCISVSQVSQVVYWFYYAAVLYAG